MSDLARKLLYPLRLSDIVEPRVPGLVQCQFIGNAYCAMLLVELLYLYHTKANKSANIFFI